MLTTRRLLSLAFALCLLFAAVTAGGCESKITDTNHARIVTGMSQSDVDAILGSGDDETTSGASITGAGLGGSSKTPDKVIRYKDSRAGTAIVVTFRDDKVFQVVKVGF